MASVEQHFAVYQDCHQDRRNKIYHYLGIPLITFGILSFLYQIPHVSMGGLFVDFALLFVATVWLYYWTLDRRLALAMAVLTTPLYLLAATTPWTAGLGAFLIGWVFQFIGHRHEGRQPAFFHNFIHILIGPLWIASHLMEKLGWWTPREVMQ